MKNEKIEVTPEKQQPTPTEASNKFLRGLDHELALVSNSAIAAIFGVATFKHFIEGNINSALVGGTICGVACIFALIELNKLVESKKSLTNYVASLEDEVDKNKRNDNK